MNVNAGVKQDFQNMSQFLEPAFSKHYLTESIEVTVIMIQKVQFNNLN